MSNPLPNQRGFMDVPEHAQRLHMAAADFIERIKNFEDELLALGMECRTELNSVLHIGGCGNSVPDDAK